MKMSRHLNIQTVTDEQLAQMNGDLTITQEPSKYAMGAKPVQFYLFELSGNDLYIPFAYGKNFPRPSREKFESREVKFEGELKDNQKPIRKAVIDSLNKTGSCIVACFPGFGKTCLSINIACKLGMPTLVICHRIILIDQWKKSIEKFCPTARVQILTATSPMEPADFYIMNAANVPKHTRKFYEGIGVLIVDECHLIMAQKLSESMRYITPRYLIGLSATPYRNDGLDLLIERYFGECNINIPLKREHIAYKVKTGFTPEVKLNRMGKVDWSSVLESQCSNQARSDLIVRIVQYFSERTFLILCKRVEQARYIISRLQEEKEDVTSLVGKVQTFEQKSRILVATAQKAGVGFDHPALDTLLLASDIEDYWVQYLGRVFRRPDTVPVVFDLVDNYSLLERHFRTRQQVYIEHGGKVKNFHSEFPDFQ